MIQVWWYRQLGLMGIESIDRYVGINRSREALRERERQRDKGRMLCSTQTNFTVHAVCQISVIHAVQLLFKVKWQPRFSLPSQASESTNTDQGDEKFCQPMCITAELGTFGIFGIFREGLGRRPKGLSQQITTFVLTFSLFKPVPSPF